MDVGWAKQLDRMIGKRPCSVSYVDSCCRGVTNVATIMFHAILQCCLVVCLKIHNYLSTLCDMLTFFYALYITCGVLTLCRCGYYFWPMCGFAVFAGITARFSNFFSFNTGIIYVFARARGRPTFFSPIHTIPNNQCLLPMIIARNYLQMRYYLFGLKDCFVFHVCQMTCLLCLQISFRYSTNLRSLNQTFTKLYSKINLLSRITKAADL